MCIENCLKGNVLLWCNFESKTNLGKQRRKIKFTTYVGEFWVKLTKVSILLVEHLNLMCLWMSGSKKVAVNADGRGTGSPQNYN